MKEGGDILRAAVLRVHRAHRSHNHCCRHDSQAMWTCLGKVVYLKFRA